CAASASNVARQHRMSACHRLAADKDCELGGEIIDRDLPLTQHDALTAQPRSDRWQQAAGSRCHSMERGTACRTGDSFGWSTWPTEMVAGIDRRCLRTRRAMAWRFVAHLALDFHAINSQQTLK